MAAGRQRVDTRGGDRGEDLEALSSDVHWKLEHLQSRINTASQKVNFSPNFGLPLGT